MITLKIENADEIAAMFRRAPNIMRKWLVKALHATNAEFSKKNVRGVTPWDTGTMSQTFQGEVDEQGLVAKYFPTRKYADFVYFGTQHQRPQKFLDDIVDLSEKNANNHFKDAVKGAAREIIKNA